MTYYITIENWYSRHRARPVARETLDAAITYIRSALVTDRDSVHVQRDDGDVSDDGGRTDGLTRAERDAVDDAAEYARGATSCAAEDAGADR